jgi:hypothetical protein
MSGGRNPFMKGGGMFAHSKSGLIYLAAVLLVAVTGYGMAVAQCSRECYAVGADCLNDGTGQCDTGDPPRCYRWFKQGSPTTISCWTCGKGNEGSANGWCVIGDSNLTCKRTDDDIQYKRFSTCTGSCTGAQYANAYVSAAVRGTDLGVIGTLKRYECRSGK